MTKITYTPTAVVAQIFGDIDHHSVKEIRETISFALENSIVDTLIFDLTNATFMDSSGIGVIMGRYREMQLRKGKIGFVGINNKIQKLVEVSGLLKIIPSYTSLEEAIS